MSRRVLTGSEQAVEIMAIQPKGSGIESSRSWSSHLATVPFLKMHTVVSLTRKVADKNSKTKRFLGTLVELWCFAW